MNITKLALAAAIAFGTIGVAAAPAAAAVQRDHNGDNGRDGNGMRGDNGRHGNNWNNGRHRGWNNHRWCRTVWRHHHRQRICTRR